MRAHTLSSQEGLSLYKHAYLSALKIEYKNFKART